MGSKKKELFVREATGLVKEVSWFNLSFYCFTAAIAVGGPLGMAYVALYPTTIVAGLPALSWIVILTGLAVFVLGYSYAYLARVMPRTGGDYVYTARILNPLVGFIDGWMAVFAAVTFIGLNLYFGILVLGTTFEAARVMPNGSPLVSLGSWMTTQTGEIVTSIPIFLLLFYLLGFTRTRTYFKVNSIVNIVALVATIVLLAIFLTIGKSSLLSNFAKFSGTNASAVIASAAGAGCCEQTINFGSLGAMLLFGLFVFTVYQYNSNVASEIKGSSTDRAILISGVAGILGGIIYFGLQFVPYMYGAGYNFVNSWNYLYWNTAAAPLNAPATAALLTAFADPNLALLSIVLFIPVITFTFIIVVPLVVYSVRNMLAFSMDRTLPEWFGSINTRTATPVKTTLLVLTLGYVLFLAGVFGLNPATTGYWATLLFLPSFIFPAVDVLILKRRRPDLYEMAPKNWPGKIFGVPIVNILAVIWLAFVLPVTVLFIAYPLITSASASTNLLSFTSSSGVLYVIIVAIAGVIIFYLSRYYHRKQGLDWDLMFKTIPPE